MNWQLRGGVNRVAVVMTPEMTEQAFGLTVSEVMAYAAAANVLLVLVLVAINA